MSGRRKGAGNHGLVPCETIAEQLGWKLKTVQSLNNRAMKKIRCQPREIVLAWLHAVAMTDAEILEAGSAECDREFIARYGE